MWLSRNNKPTSNKCLSPCQVNTHQVQGARNSHSTYPLAIDKPSPSKSHLVSTQLICLELIWPSIHHKAEWKQSVKKPSGSPLQVVVVLCLSYLELRVFFSWRALVSSRSAESSKHLSRRHIHLLVAPTGNPVESTSQPVPYSTGDCRCCLQHTKKVSAITSTPPHFRNLFSQESMLHWKRFTSSVRYIS